jgi:chromosomal replication initiation ATPase DnaA
MILRIQVPDAVYEAFGTVNPTNPRRSMEELLEKFAGTDPKKKQVLLEGEVLSEIQKALSTSVDSAEGLLDALKHALRFKVDGIEIQLTDAQRKKLVTQAEAWKRPVEEFIRQQVTDNLRSI